MLDLEVIPERSLGCDNWEFILGKYKQRNFFDFFSCIRKEEKFYMKITKDCLEIQLKWGVPFSWKQNLK